jgi:hypothetical protein
MGCADPANATPIRRGRRRVGLTVLCAVVALAISISPARAVDPAAELLFQEGRRLLLDGQYVDACARFTQSYAVEASSGTLLNLALCNEKLGKTATALAEYRQSARLAQDQGRQDRVTAALQKADELELTVARLTLVPTETGGELKILLDGGTVHEDKLGVPEPIDPGSHEVVASAPGRRPWQVAVEIKDGDKQTLEVPVLEQEPPAAPTIVRIAPPTAPVPSPAPASKVDLYLAASGGLLFLAGAGIWSVAVVKFDSAQNACNSFPGCSADDRQGRISTIQRLETVAFGSWIAAGALVAGAAIHHWGGKPSAPKLMVAPTASGGAEVSFGGAF